SSNCAATVPGTSPAIATSPTNKARLFMAGVFYQQRTPRILTIRRQKRGDRVNRPRTIARFRISESGPLCGVRILRAIFIIAGFANDQSTLGTDGAARRRRRGVRGGGGIL